MAAGKDFGKIKLYDNDTIFTITYDGTIRFIIDKATGAVTLGAVAGTGAVSLTVKSLSVAEQIIQTGTNTKSYLQIPVLTTAQRDALSGAANGMLIYNSTLGKFQGYEAGAWANLI